MIVHVEVYELPNLPDNEDFNAAFPDLQSIQVEYEFDDNDDGSWDYRLSSTANGIDIDKYLTPADERVIIRFIERD